MDTPIEQLIDHTVEILLQGGVILYPTDTIWGIGCDATNSRAIERIFEIKKRDANKSMIILVENDRRLQELVEVPPAAWDIMDLSEKPVTIVYEHPRHLPRQLLAPDGSVGIRVIKEPVIEKLIRRLNRPLVSTSANLSGDKSPLRFSDINTEIISKVDYSFPYRMEEQAIYTGSSVLKIWNDNRIKVLRE